MFYVHMVFDNATGDPVAPELLDRVGGMLATNQPSMTAATDGPEVTVTLAIEGVEAVDHVLDGALWRTLDAFEAVNVALVVRSATVYTEAEYERVNADTAR